MKKVSSLKGNSFVSICPSWLYTHDNARTLLLDWKNSFGGWLIIILWVSQQKLSKQNRHKLHPNKFKHFSVSAVKTKIFIIISILRCSKWGQFISGSYVKLVTNFLC